jgi:hypothetical protein
MDLLEAGKINQRKIFGEEKVFLMHFFLYVKEKQERKLDAGENETILGRKGNERLFFYFWNN